MEKGANTLVKMVLVVKAFPSLCPRDGVVVGFLGAVRRGLEAGHRSKKRTKMTS
jgi:hypothetical protein